MVRDVTISFTEINNNKKRQLRRGDSPACLLSYILTGMNTDVRFVRGMWEDMGCMMFDDIMEDYEKK